MFGLRELFGLRANGQSKDSEVPDLSGNPKVRAQKKFSSNNYLTRHGRCAMRTDFIKGVAILAVIAFAGVLLLKPRCAKKEPEVYKIGAILSLTGYAASYGDMMKKGMERSSEKRNLRAQREETRRDLLRGCCIFCLTKVSFVYNVKFVKDRLT